MRPTLQLCPRMGLALLLGLAQAAGLGGGAGLQGPAQGPSVRAEVDTTVVTVGDRVTLTVSVDHPVGTQVAWPDSLDLASFEVLEAHTAPEAAQGEVVRSTLVLTLAAFELGELEIPSIRVGVVGPGEEETALETRRLGIRVESVGLDEGGDIRGIKGPLSIPRSLLGILLPLLLAVAVTVAGWLLYGRMRRRRKRLVDPEPGLPSRPPHEIALEALDRLEASPLLERGEVKEYHIQASGILRVYVEGRFQVPALEMTTRDVTRGLEEMGLDPPVREGFRQFLQRCDMVKFAKHRPGSEVSRPLLDLGRHLVKATIPVPESTPEPGAAPPGRTGDGPGPHGIHGTEGADGAQEVESIPSGGGGETALAVDGPSSRPSVGEES